MIKPSEKNKSIVAGDKLIPIRDATDLQRQHLRMYPRTPELELDGINLIRSNFEPVNLRQFIKGVCHWGGYPGVAGRVLKRNSIEKIQICLADAMSILSNDQPDVGEALDEVIKIKDFNISFGSKHLRFLRPDICAILDRIISTSLGYKLSLYGYKKYSFDCTTVARYFEQEEVVNLMNRGGKWFPSDVDMVVFAYLRLKNQDLI